MMTGMSLHNFKEVLPMKEITWPKLLLLLMNSLAQELSHS